MSSWVEVADGVLLRRYESLDVNVCVVRGSDELLLVDTRSCPREADEIRADLRALRPATVRCVVNTHAHYDHSFGNQRFGPGSDLDLPVYGHRLLAKHLDDFERPRLTRWVAEGVDPVDNWRHVVVVAPSHVVNDRLELDVGGRTVELVHLGRGHTDNDLLIRVPDADVWLTGDVVEASGPPMYGSGCFPLEWPDTSAALIARLTSGDVVVPGHGPAVERQFVEHQHALLVEVADAIRELYAGDVPAEDAVGVVCGRLPLPDYSARTAVVSGFDHLRAASPGESSPGS